MAEPGMECDVCALPADGALLLCPDCMARAAGRHDGTERALRAILVEWRRWTCCLSLPPRGDATG